MSNVIHGAIRTLRRRPAMTIVMLGALAASMVAVTLLFGTLRDALAEPLPYPDASELVAILGTNEEWRSSGGALQDSWDRAPVTLSQVEAFRYGNVGIAHIGAFRPFSEAEVRFAGHATTLAGAWLDTGVFETLGIQPQLGRLPYPDEYAAGDRVAVIHRDLWQTHYSGRPDVIGRTLELDGRTYTVIGVTGPGFFFPQEAAGIWVPVPAALRAAGRDRPLFHAIARRAEEVGLRELNERLELLAAQVAEANPRLAGLGVRAVPYRGATFSSLPSGTRLLIETDSM